MTVRVPRVWVVASHRLLGNEHGHPQWYTVMDEGGTRSLLELGLQPVTYPGVPAERLDQVLDAVDAVFLGGSATNVHPAHYGSSIEAGDQQFDDTRDAVSLPLVRLAIARRVPLLGVCRGSHEINVALGGSLHQSLQRLSGSLVHWEDPDEPLEAQYAERHRVTCVSGGALQALVACETFRVSSLHSQGVRTLAPTLVAEAHAEDGLVEAFRWQDAGQFAWGFQFHPEWEWRTHPCYSGIMTAFVRACEEQVRRRPGLPA
jgi:putative glutamine amidotransferase